MAGKKVPDMIVVRTVNAPGYQGRVQRPKYEAMRTALLRVLPTSPPGLTQAQMGEAVLPHLPAELFPGGAKALWWVKTVQLDLEAKRRMARDASAKPIRWWKT